MKLTAIILTGGKSSRMGQDKALIELNGQTLLERAVRFCGSFADEVFISSDSEYHKQENFQIIADEIKNCGPIGGIYSCLKQSANEWNFVLSVDSPFVEKEFVKFLINSVANFDAVVPVHDGKKEPLIALYNKRTISQLESKINEGDYRMHFLLQKLDTYLVESGEWLEKYPNLFQNFNYPEDLNNL